jgi:ankyrin repeat protein
VIKRSEEEEETVMLLVKMGGEALAKDAVGNAPLHRAAGAGHVETIKLLVEVMGSGVIAAQGADRDMPLHLAAANGRVETVRTVRGCQGQRGEGDG